MSISFSRNNNKVRVPIIGSLGKDNLHLSEIWMCDVLDKLLVLRQGLFIDVGVNLGQTLIKLKLVNKDIAYVGFDPNPICIFYTKELIKANNFLNAHLVPVGISDENELVTLFFYTDGDADTSATIVSDFRPKHIFRREYVACFKYEHAERIIKPEDIGIIKIDVEGAEGQVLKGMMKLLRTNRPFILIEILPVYSAENMDRLRRQQEIESMMNELDYKILRINKQDEQHTSFQLLNSIGISTRIEDSDYLLCPAEMVHRIPDIVALESVK